MRVMLVSIDQNGRQTNPKDTDGNGEMYVKNESGGLQYLRMRVMQSTLVRYTTPFAFESWLAYTTPNCVHTADR